MTTSPESSVASNDRAQPLAGITVIDMTNVLAGPFAGYQLACLGARVIKVESPDGDLARRLGAKPDFARAGMGISFLAVNAGKESVAVNLKDPEGKELFLRLVDQADCVLENFRPGVMKRLGLAPDALLARKPGLVVCSLSGFGATGPLAHRPAYDQIIQGFSGLMSVTGTPETAPLRAGFPVCDTIGGLNGALAVAAALVKARTTGEGAIIDVSMLDSAIAAMGWVVSNYVCGGVEPAPLGNDNFTAAPSGTFETGEGRLNIAANEQKQFVALVTLLDAPHLATDARFAEREARKKNRAALTKEIEARLASKSAAEWDDILTAAGVPCGLVLSVPQIMGHPHVTGGELLAEYDEVPGVDTAVRVVRTGFRINGQRPKAATRPPTLSEHRDALLAELGYDAADRQRLTEKGIVA